MNPTSAWRSAQAPQYVYGPSEQPVAPSRKQREAEALAAAVRAHIDAGGRYEVLTPVQAPATSAPLGELLDGEA